ncbi:MAG: winged helix-turn-helix transcriptional regulator [Novosphingobium sp.]|nr:winged helix-turn-helix transcriptional regulator [Novosphingobium sp.]
MSKALKTVQAERPELSSEEISAFCNAIGLAPRGLVNARDRVTARYALGPRGAWILGLIERGVNSPSALTDILCIGRSLTTAEINRLTDAGLVEGRQSDKDRRRVDLVLTEEGWKACAELRVAVEDFVTSRLTGWSREEVLSCIALLQDFVGATRMGEG